MMPIIKGVDVLDRACFERPCFRRGEDKGTFVQGRGYTSYHPQPRRVCMTRHLLGCPDNSVCPECRTVSVLEPGEQCGRCPGVLVEL